MKTQRSFSPKASNAARSAFATLIFTALFGFAGVSVGAEGFSVIERLRSLVGFTTVTDQPLNSTPQTLPYSQQWPDSGQITINHNWAGVPGIEGYILRNDAVTTAGVDPRTITGDTFGAGTTTVEMNVLANQTNAGTLVGGLAEFHTLQGFDHFTPFVGFQGSPTADAAFLLINLNTTGRTGIDVFYYLSDVDCAFERNSVQQFTLQFRVGNTGHLRTCRKDMSQTQRRVRAGVRCFMVRAVFYQPRQTIRVSYNFGL